MNETLSLLQGISLGLIQGVTEFLPVSSSGHLAALQNIWGIDLHAGHTLDLLLHLATLAVVLIFARRELRDVILLRDIPALKFIIIGNIPAAVVGLGFREEMKQLGDSLLIIGCAWIVTGVWMLIAEQMRSRDNQKHEAPSLIDSIVIGIAQAVAITPGVSRSGATIGAAYICGVAKERAIRLSFLLSAPVIGGAVLTGVKDIEALQIPLATVLTSCAAATISGYAALQLLVQVVRNYSLRGFSIYCIAIGLITIIFFQT